MAASDLKIRLISDIAGIRQVEALQNTVWGREDVVPYHMLLAAVHGGGVLLGAYREDELAGFVFGFAAFDDQEGELNLRHHSHMLAVRPEARDMGIGFALKRAQWQWVRRQGIERITWTYDPLQSRNANLNIRRLGAVCSTYFPDYYGEMTDLINAGLPSDRFQVDWWVNSPRTENRLHKRPRRPLALEDYFSAGAEIVNPTQIGPAGHPLLPEKPWSLGGVAEDLGAEAPQPPPQPPFYLIEIPPDFSALKEADAGLARRWRLQTRELFQSLFGRGYLVTDFLFLRGESPRSFYVLSDGERQLGAFQKKARP